jgi:hypothetical protein
VCLRRQPLSPPQVLAKFRHHTVFLQQDTRALKCRMSVSPVSRLNSIHTDRYNAMDTNSLSITCKMIFCKSTASPTLTAVSILRQTTQSTVTPVTEHNDQTSFVAHSNLSPCSFNKRRLIKKKKLNIITSYRQINTISCRSNLYRYAFKVSIHCVQLLNLLSFIQK